MNDAAMNIRVQISIESLLSVLLGYIPMTGIAGSYGNSVLKFLRNRHTVFSIAAAPFYIPTHSAHFQFHHHILANTCYFLLIFF